VNPPFTIEQFLGVFVSYNAAIWPAQIVAYGMGLIAVAALASERQTATQSIAAVLAVMWAWNGIGYHSLSFSAINPAAKVFAVFFIVEAILFVRCALADPPLHFRIGRDFQSLAGSTCIAYAMLVYPILGIWAEHGLMSGPMFGVAPCPTTIFTIGMLLLARGAWVKWLSIIPLLWSLVGFAAALQLGIREDLGLAVAGLWLLILVVGQLMQGEATLVPGAAKP
jgi:Family of unknown function (DUF6064)